MAGYVRPRAGIPALLHPETGVLVIPDPAVPVKDNDPLVKKFRWAFVTEEEAAAEAEANARAHGPVEQATAAPGEKRNAKR